MYFRSELKILCFFKITTSFLHTYAGIKPEKDKEPKHSQGKGMLNWIIAKISTKIIMCEFEDANIKYLKYFRTELGEKK